MTSFARKLELATTRWCGDGCGYRKPLSDFRSGRLICKKCESRDATERKRKGSL